AVSAKPPVRAFLLEMQRKLAREHNVLMDGRDIGTVVLPQATVKIFLTASPETRAKRRAKELEEKGTPVPFDEVLADIIKRDHNDMNRPIAPLKQAEDAVLADTSSCTFEESVELVLSIIRERLG
ncbi:MAG: (d)CMP kinase, partial [Clostridia bacterium]|nr:(d)CMP kinase [Clostridia bacterium]